jgi:hypothetical protein
MLLTRFVIALLRVRKPYSCVGTSPHNPPNPPGPLWQFTVLQDAGSNLPAMLASPVLMRVADNLLLGNNVPRTYAAESTC